MSAKLNQHSALSQTKISTPGEERTLWHLATAPNGGFSFGTERVEANCCIPAHSHEESDEVIFVYEGTALCTVGSEECNIGKGEAVCIPAKTVHSIRNTTDAPLLLTWTLSPPQQISQFKANSNEV